MNKEVQDSLKQVGIRMVEEPPLLSSEPMNNPEAAVRVLGEWLSEMDRELFCVVNLNTNLTPINMNVVSMGTLNTVYVNPRETMKSAILSNAAYLMLIHNHPSGSLNPSKEDITITDRIQNTAAVMGIPVLDHIIVGRNQEFFSLRENNIFSFANDIQYTSELSKLRWTQQMSAAERSSSQFISDITDRLQELRKDRELEKENDDKVINSDADPVVTEWRKAIDERTIFARTDDFYAIYQYDHTDGDWGYEFMGLDFVENMGLSVDGQDYRIMYIGTLDQTETLDTLFQKFNIDKPEDFEGHSMSTSDVIIIKRDGEMKAYYVDNIGFKELSEFVLQRANLLERSLEQESPSVYKATLEQAVEEGKADTYLDSRRLNIDCKNAIEKAISENYDGISLNPNTANVVLNIVDIYGEQRVSFVLANTLHQLSKDGRFSERNKQWGKTIEIPENIRQGVDLNRDFIINSHPAVINVFIDLVRKEFRDRNLEEALETRVAQITANTKGFEAEGHEGTWYVFDQKVYHGETFSLMRHEQYGSRVADIVVAEDGTLVAEDVWYGFDTKVQEVIFDYLREHGITIEINEPKQSEDSVTFYAAECMEFPNMGEFYENLTLEEAIEKYESIPAERINAVKGIGFELHDGSDYEGKYDLMHLGQVDRGNVEMIQYYQKNPIIMNALNRLEQYCGEKKQSADKIIQSVRTQDTTRKKKQYQIQKGLY